MNTYSRGKQNFAIQRYYFSLSLSLLRLQKIKKREEEEEEATNFSK